MKATASSDASVARLGPEAPQAAATSTQAARAVVPGVPAPSQAAAAPPKGTSAPRLSARERLLAAADELFYGNGINTVGIDRVIEHAGVAKASLYDCFGSKDELIRAYLLRRGERRQARINERLAKCETPEEKILSIFDVLAESASQPSYRGCAFVRAGADANSSDSVKSVCESARAFMRDKFTELARAAGATDPEVLGCQLLLLYDGAATAAYMDTNANAVNTARAAAAQMLSAAVAKPKRSSTRSR
jgi:AcrR family transcriptional regulator